ncbi:subtilisin-like protein, partial [Basidiobolus meristosporus CBS 931.73]
NIADKFLGFVGEISDQQLKRLRNLSWIDYVESEGHFLSNDQITLQLDPPNWGLPRISHRKRSLHLPYIYNSKAGSGVDVYVLDSGVNVAHLDFQGRARLGANFVDEVADDLKGHGTHVAGIIAGSTYGVAKKANIISVKVIPSNGHAKTSSIIQGLEWAVKTIQRRKTNSVINMSFNGRRSQAINDAIAAAATVNIPVVVSAGNKRSDSCKFSPASADWALTVGATDKHDRKAKFSNFGKCVNIFAPGRKIRSTSIGSIKATALKSGTSMAAPHVTGVAALFLSQRPFHTPKQLYETILRVATSNMIANLTAESPNLLAYNMLEHTEANKLE